MSVNFVLLANSTTCDKMLDEGGQARPPEVTFKDGLGAEDSHVSRERGRVNRMEKGRAGSGRDIHPFAEVKMAIIK